VFPYLAFFSTRWAVEQCRLDGTRFEDHFYNKFFRETYVSWHIYAQNFHPISLHERTLDIAFFRKYDALFKGFSVPEWAQSNKWEGYDFDFYSRSIWDKAIMEAKYEQTPMPSHNERLGPNLLNIARWEDCAGGYGSRYFYNEVPKPNFYRYKGTFEA